MPTQRQFDPTVDYYAILNVPVNATKDQITRNYRNLMRKTHPDNFTDPRASRNAEERTKVINAAYSTLTQPEIRREYDLARRRSINSQTVTQQPASARYQPAYRVRRQPRYRTAPQHLHTQRSAYRKAVRQLAVTFGSVTVGIIVLILLFTLAAAAVQLLLS